MTSFSVFHGYSPHRPGCEFAQYGLRHAKLIAMVTWWLDRLKPPATRLPIQRFVHDDVIKWKHFPRYWPFVRGIHRSLVNSPHKGQWRGALMFPLICVWINAWVNNREAGDLRRHRAHYDVTVMFGLPTKEIWMLRIITEHLGENPPEVPVRSQRPINAYHFTIPWHHQRSLQWRHNGHDGVSNHQPHHCLLNSLFRCRSKKISKFCVAGLCAGNSPVTGEFPAQMASNAENVSIWWRHHDPKWNRYDSGLGRRQTLVSCLIIYKKNPRFQCFPSNDR